jgi:hypothetical protein
MKISKVLHVLSVIAGIMGLLSLFGVWGNGANGITGYSETHLFNDSTALFLVAIWLQIATMHHMMIEKKG